MKFIDLNDNEGHLFNQHITGGALVLFFSPQCGHCTDMKPQWNALKQQIPLLEPEMEDANIVSVNAGALKNMDNKWAGMADGVPTIFIVKPGGIPGPVFDEERKTQEFINFMKKHLHKKNTTHQNGGKLSKAKRKHAKRKHTKRKHTKRKHTKRKLTRKKKRRTKR